MQSIFKNWVLAARLKTLPAAVIPVIIGCSIAWNDGYFDLVPALVAMICALLIQIGTNFANDYYDHVKGADTKDRIGFERATSSGWISPNAMFTATIITMSLAFFIGLYLVWHAGIVVLFIGVLSLIFGIAYTGGPYPLGYNGLGDVFVFIFFGIVAVMTTYYVQAMQWSMITFWASLPVGALATNILVVNNLRDVPTDSVTGKRTLGILLGEKALKIEYTLFVILAVSVPLVFKFIYSYNYIILLPLMSIPLFIMLIREVWFFEHRPSLNNTLVKSAMVMTVYGILFSIGIILG
ncbi:MAG TPA: 1,4-dihydroxy-2-naphthoate octaprenyltransferase [Bacteroidetes bacterium]|nr:1,4-dihydroxy-2-naphthoate octaprenyltransferase [Bacteroidota bacterium]